MDSKKTKPIQAQEIKDVEQKDVRSSSSVRPKNVLNTSETQLTTLSTKYPKQNIQKIIGICEYICEDTNYQNLRIQKEVNQDLVSTLSELSHLQIELFESDLLQILKSINQAIDSNNITSDVTIALAFIRLSYLNINSLEPKNQLSHLRSNAFNSLKQIILNNKVQDKKLIANLFINILRFPGDLSIVNKHDLIHFFNQYFYTHRAQIDTITLMRIIIGIRFFLRENNDISLSDKTILRKMIRYIFEQTDTRGIKGKTILSFMIDVSDLININEANQDLKINNYLVNQLLNQFQPDNFDLKTAEIFTASLSILFRNGIIEKQFPAIFRHVISKLNTPEIMTPDISKALEILSSLIYIYSLNINDLPLHDKNLIENAIHKYNNHIIKNKNILTTDKIRIYQKIMKKNDGIISQIQNLKKFESSADSSSEPINVSNCRDQLHKMMMRDSYSYDDNDAIIFRDKYAIFMIENKHFFTIEEHIQLFKILPQIQPHKIHDEYCQKFINVMIDQENRKKLGLKALTWNRHQILEILHAIQTLGDYIEDLKPFAKLIESNYEPSKKHTVDELLSLLTFYLYYTIKLKNSGKASSQEIEPLIKKIETIYHQLNQKIIDDKFALNDNKLIYLNLAAQFLNRPALKIHFPKSSVSNTQKLVMAQIAKKFPTSKIEEEVSMLSLPPTDIVLDQKYHIEVNGYFHFIGANKVRSKAISVIKEFILKQHGIHTLHIDFKTPLMPYKQTMKIIDEAMLKIAQRLADDKKKKGLKF